MQKAKESVSAPVIYDNPVVDWIDRELTDTYKLSYSDTLRTNILLEVRHLFVNLTEANIHRSLPLFYRLLPRLERSYYLLGYRIRSWVSMNFQFVGVDPLQREKPIVAEICQTLRSLEAQRKVFFELFNYSIPFNDLRMKIQKKI